MYAALMSHMLERDEYCLEDRQAEQVAQVVCDWSIEPGVKVSTLVWTLSILNRLSRQVEWVGDVLCQLIEMNDMESSPGMRALLRRVHKSFKIA